MHNVFAPIKFLYDIDRVLMGIVINAQGIPSWKKNFYTKGELHYKKFYFAL